MRGAALESALKQAEAESRQLLEGLKSGRARRRETASQQAEALARAQHALNEVMASASWRITAPLRRLRRFVLNRRGTESL